MYLRHSSSNALFSSPSRYHPLCKARITARDKSGSKLSFIALRSRNFTLRTLSSFSAEEDIFCRFVRFSSTLYES